MERGVKELQIVEALMSGFSKSVRDQCQEQEV